MNFEITIETESSVQKKLSSLRELSKAISLFLSEKHYGDGVKNFFIGVICIKTRPGYEEWYKPRKPNYKDFEMVEVKVDIYEKVIGIFTYDLKLDYEKIRRGEENDNLDYLVHLIISSLDNLDKIPKKIKNFDRQKIKEDLNSFLLEYLKQRKREEEGESPQK